VTSALPHVTIAGAGAIYAIRFEVLRVLPMMAKVTRHNTTTAASSSSSKGTVMHTTLSREEFLSFRSALDSAKQRVIDSIEQADEMRLETVLEDLDCDEDIADALLVMRTDKVVQTVLTLCYSTHTVPISGSRSRRAGR